MKLKEFYNRITEKAKQHKIVLLISLVYSFIWAVCKIIFGAFTYSYFFCISGASTLIFGFIKIIYLKHYKSDDFEEKKGKSIVISILLITSSALFTFYMARLFFISDVNNYGIILSITIAACSFFELSFSIFNYVKAKKTKDILLQSFKGCSLISSCFANVLTQVALLSATGSKNNFQNAITGILAGCISMLIGTIILIKSLKLKQKNTTEK